MKTLVTGGSGFVGNRLIQRLLADGHQVRAIARSDQAAAKIAELGAEVARASLADTEALVHACEGVEVVFHAAAYTGEWASWQTFYDANVTGTRNILKAASDAKVQRFVHVSTEAVLLDGSPLLHVDEARPLPRKTIGYYGRSKAMAESLVRTFEGQMETISLRPRFVWGKGDTSLTPKLVEGVQAGRFKWIDHGEALTSTCHVDNLCEGMVLAATKGRPGAVYFLTDGPPISVKEVLSRILEGQGVSPGKGSLPLWLARSAARLCEWVWAGLRLRSAPPATRTAVLLIGQQMTVDDSLARKELGYSPRIERSAGLAELGASAPIPAG